MPASHYYNVNLHIEVESFLFGIVFTFKQRFVIAVNLKNK